MELKKFDTKKYLFEFKILKYKYKFKKIHQKIKFISKNLSLEKRENKKSN